MTGEKDADGVTDRATEKVKVLYIAGTMRSGSTLLGRLLGELPRAVDVGELGLLFSPEFRERGRCGCLKKVYDCDFWQAVFECAFGGMDRMDTRSLHEIKQMYRMRTVPRLLLRRDASHVGRLQEYVHALDALYRAVQKVSGARVIVDASKDPVFGYLLDQAPHVDLRAVHLVRDSRAVAYSQQRLKADPPWFSNPAQLPVVKPTTTALTWNAINGLLSLKTASKHAAFLRYEDFVADPVATLSRLWALMEEPNPDLAFLKEPVLHFHTSHTVAGNPDRFQADVKIRPDVAWQKHMIARDRRLVTALTFPLLLRYGYFRPRASAEGRTEARPARGIMRML